MTQDLPDAAVVLTKVILPDALAAICAMNGVLVDAVPAEVGCVAVCRSAGTGDPEMAAQVISGMLKASPVVLLAQRDGQMSAVRWSAGEEQEELSPALALGEAPPEIEGLLLGQGSVDDLEGVVTSVGMTRWKAMRIIVGVARANRKRARAARKAGQAGDDEVTGPDGPL